MKLFYIFTTILALTLAENEKQEVGGVQNNEDSEVQATNTRQIQQLIQKRSAWSQPDEPSLDYEYSWSNPDIGNNINWGDHGEYRYEYKTPSGTHVFEEGWFNDPKQTPESLVKTGWYSYLGPDGKTYKVTYWADKTGFHSSGGNDYHIPSMNLHNKHPVPSTPQHPTYPEKPIFTPFLGYQSDSYKLTNYK